jgi:hypothetical protein
VVQAWRHVIGSWGDVEADVAGEVWRWTHSRRHGGGRGRGGVETDVVREEWRRTRSAVGVADPTRRSATMTVVQAWRSACRRGGMEADTAGSRGIGPGEVVDGQRSMRRQR